MTAVAAGAIFLVAVVAIITRPAGGSEAAVAVAGAVLMLLTGVLSPGAAAAAVLGEWNVLLFFLGMMAATAVAERAGIFAAAGALAAAAGVGSGRRLLLAVFGVGALTTTFLSNDATALILTPVVLATVRRLKVPAVPYLMATSFVANTASSALPISNPVNLVVADRAGLDLAYYATHVLPVAVVATAINAAVFLRVYGRELDRSYTFDWRGALRAAARDRAFFRATAIGLALLCAAFVAGGAAGLPLGAVAAAGGAALLGVGRRSCAGSAAASCASASAFPSCSTWAASSSSWPPSGTPA